jgi:CRP-like cAMP-binding protein
LDEEILLQELPTNIRAEVANYTYQNVFQNIKFFKDKDPAFILSFLPCLKRISAEKDEILYNQGKIAEEVYFLLSGRVKMVNLDGFIFRHYVEGSYFGDIEILLSQVNP